MTRHFHLPTLIGLMILYLAWVVLLVVLPHQERPGRFGKMEAHQLFAKAGRVASLGMIDCTLVDWYMRGPTMEDNIGPYNRIVAHSAKVLTPVFAGWMLLMSVLAAAYRKHKHGQNQQIQTIAGKPGSV